LVFASFWGGYATLPQNSTTTKTQLTKALNERKIMELLPTVIFLLIVLPLFIWQWIKTRKTYNKFKDPEILREIRELITGAQK
jgi:hypothetical protein